MADFDPIHVDFLLNRDDVKRDSAAIKKDITGTDASAQRSAQKVGETVKRVYDQNVKEVSEYTAAVRQSEAQLRKNTAIVGRSAKGFNTLNHSINQISRELPAFAVSAQIGILALSNNIPILADEINKLKRQNEALIASGQKGVPVWKSILKGIFSWQTALSLGITFLTIYGREFVAWINTLTKGKSSIDSVKESQEALNDALESSDYKKAVKNVLSLKTNIDLAKKGMIDAKDVVEEYNKSIGKAVGTAKDLNEVEQLLVQNANDYVQMMLYKAAANLALDKAAQEALESAQEQMKLEDELESVREKILAKEASGDTALSAGRGGASEYALLLKDRALLTSELNKMKSEGERAIAERNRIFKALQKKAASFGLDMFLNEGSGGKKAVSNRQALLDKIAALDKEYARKRLNSDKEEIQALKDKFEKVRELVRRFNADPANKGAAIALGGLDAAEQKALSDLKYKQETKAMATAIQEQRSIYKEYEAFKTEHGKKAADERFKNELKGFKTYSDFLQSKLDENKAALDAVASGSATGGQQERVELLRAAAEDEANAQQKKFDRLIAQLRTYEEQKLRIEEAYQEKELKLREQYTGSDLDKRLEVLSIQKDKELTELNEAAFKESELYRDLNEKILGMTRNQIQDHLALLKQALSQGFFQAADGTIFKLTKAQTDELNQVIPELEELLNETNPLFNDAEKLAEAFGSIGQGLGSMARGLYDLNPELAETLETMEELAYVGANAAKAVAGFASGNVLGGITGAIGAIGGLFGIILRNKAASEAQAKRTREELERFQLNIEKGEWRINELIRERLLMRAQEVELTHDQLEATRKVLEQNASVIQGEFQELFDELQGEQYIKAIHRIFQPLKGYINVKQYASLFGLSFDEIEKLFEQGKLEGRAKELFEQLRKLKEEGVDIDAQLAELQRKTNEIWTGTSQESIAEGIIQGLREGKTAVEDFAGDMEELLQNAILNAIKYQTLEEPLAEFYKQFAEMAESDGTLSEAEIAQLRALYESIVGQALESYEQLSEILDQDLLSGEDTASGLRGAIQRELTEETASELTGLYRATFDVMKRQEAAMTKQIQLEQKALNHSAKIERNTADTVQELKLAVAELKAIKKNTKDSSTGYDKGI